MCQKKKKKKERKKEKCRVMGGTIREHVKRSYKMSVEKRQPFRLTPHQSEGSYR